MAKHKLEEQHTLSMTGILDTDRLNIEIDENGVFSLQDLLRVFDGECVSITVRKRNKNVV